MLVVSTGTTADDAIAPAEPVGLEAAEFCSTDVGCEVEERLRALSNAVLAFPATVESTATLDERGTFLF